MQVLNRRDPEVRIDKTHIYVGRPSPWGNPFPTGPTRDRHTAVELFRDFAYDKTIRNPHWLDTLRDAEALICWCAPLECHADVLAELIDGTS